MSLKHFLCIAVLVFTSACSLVEPKYRRAGPVELLPIAVEAFSQKFQRYQGDESELAIYMADIENYRIEIVQHSLEIQFTFKPRPFQGQPLKGGGAVIVVARDSLEVTQKSFFR